MELLPSALICGITVNDFWYMTVDEINLVIETYNKLSKKELSDRYDTCKLNAYFVGLVINGKELPDITEVYPDAFDDTDENAELTLAEIENYKKLFSMVAVMANESRRGK